MLYKRRQRKKLNDTIPPSAVAGVPTFPTIGTDNFEHETGASELGDMDIRAGGVLRLQGNDLDTQQDDRLRRRATLELWKKGVVPPVHITPPTPEVEVFPAALGDEREESAIAVAGDEVTSEGAKRETIVVSDREGSEKESVRSHLASLQIKIPTK